MRQRCGGCQLYPSWPLPSRALQLRWDSDSLDLGVWNLARDRLWGVRQDSLSEASTSSSVQWRKLDLVKFFIFPWQCKHCPHGLFSLLPFSLASYSPSHSFPGIPISIFHFLTFAQPSSSLLLCGCLAGSGCQRAMAIF